MELAHHEKLNGEGYPLGLREPDIPLQSRIMMVCDIFDALCAADRPYKKAVPVADALAVAREVRAVVGEGRVVEMVRRSGKFGAQLKRLETAGFSGFVLVRAEASAVVRGELRTLGG